MKVEKDIYNRFKSMFTDEFTEDDFSDLLWYSSEDEMDKLIDYLKSKLPQVSNIKYGASKLVIFLENEPDWVIKFPLKGNATMWLENGRMNVDIEDEYYRAWGNECNFEDYDYCAVEELIYETMKRKFSKFCARTKSVGKIGDVTMYISEQAEGEIYLCGPSSQDSRKKAAEYVSSNKDIHIQSWILAIFYDMYGQDASNRFFHELYSLGYGKDLHSGNFATNKQGKIICIDYSDFNDYSGVI